MFTEVRLPLKLAAAGVALAATSLISGITSANAATLGAGTYVLESHPDGNQAPPAYGLRLDGLFGDTSEEVTFDFDNALSSMTLTYDDVANEIIIQGLAYGGVDAGADYDLTKVDVFEIDFTYTNVVVNGMFLETSTGSGTIFDTNTVSATDLGSYSLVSETGTHSYAFRIGTNHRGVSTFSGWGWVNHCPVSNPSGCDTHVYASDWLFKLGDDVPQDDIPEPFTIMGSLAALGAGAVLKRNRDAKKTA